MAKEKHKPQDIAAAEMAIQEEAPPEQLLPTAPDFEDLPEPPGQFETIGTPMPGREGQPEAGEPSEAPAGEIPADLYDSLKDDREAMPMRVFHFRCDTAKWKKGPKAHYYETVWVCQEEPFTGRKVYKNIMWVDAATLEAAAAGDPVAVKRCRIMWEGKDLMRKARCPHRNLGQFLAEHPEMRLRLTLKEDQVKVGYDTKGEPVYKPKGKFHNEVDEFLPLA